MSDQPEALRLAEYMDAPLNDPEDVADAAAAELRRLHAEVEAMRADYGNACKLVADMHAAATGRPGEGPRLGVVEDVAAVRAERDELRATVKEFLTVGLRLDAEAFREERDEARALLSGVLQDIRTVQAERDALRAECEGRRENERKFSLFMHAVMDERDKLRDFALYYARCPCCQQEANCVDDCTFSSDDPNAAEAMGAARAALKEVNDV